MFITVVLVLITIFSFVHHHPMIDLITQLVYLQTSHCYSNLIHIIYDITAINDPVINLYNWGRLGQKCEGLAKPEMWITSVIPLFPIVTRLCPDHLRQNINIINHFRLMFHAHMRGVEDIQEE